MSFEKPPPILRIFDEAKARVDWEHRFEPGTPLYMQISKGECVIHLSEHFGDGAPGARMRIETSELDAFHAELIAKRYKYARPGVEDMPWGTRDMSIRSVRQQADVLRHHHRLAAAR